MKLQSGHDLLTTPGTTLRRELGAIWADYSKWVLSRVHFERALIQPKDTPDQYKFDVLLGLLGSIGLAAEAGEVLDEHKKLLFHGSDYAVKRKKIVEELGDKFWYAVCVMEAHHITLEEVLSFNVDKLNAKDGLDGEKFSDRAKSGL